MSLLTLPVSQSDSERVGAGVGSGCATMTGTGYNKRKMKTSQLKVPSSSVAVPHRWFRVYKHSTVMHTSTLATGMSMAAFQRTRTINLQAFTSWTPTTITLSCIPRLYMGLLMNTLYHDSPLPHVDKRQQTGWFTPVGRDKERAVLISQMWRIADILFLVIIATTTTMYRWLWRYASIVQEFKLVVWLVPCGTQIKTALH